MKAIKLPSGQYRCRADYYINGTRHFKSFTAATAKEAEYKAIAFKLGNERMSDKSNERLCEAVEDYIASNIAVLSPSTIRGYRTVQKAWINSIADVPLGKLNNDILQRWISGLAKNHSPKTVSNAWGLVSAVIRTYLPGQQFNINLPKKTKNDIVIPSDEEVKQLLESTDDAMHLAVLLSAHCGLRRGEICGLQWNDVDMKKKQIRVRTAVVLDEDGFLQNKAPKSYAGNRDVDMTDAVYNALSSADRSKAPVPLSPNQITDRFARLCKKLGYDFHFHLLRHYYCSTLAMLSVPEAIAEKLCGHSSAMVHKIYVHTMDDVERKYRESIVSHFN